MQNLSLKSAGLQEKVQEILYLPLRVSMREKANFFRILTTLLLSGIPILKAMEIAEEKVHNEKLTEIIRFLHDHIAQGDSLSWSMKNFPQVFTDTEIGLVEAGEKTGTIDQSLSRISQDLEKFIELRSKVISALLYPIIILCLLAVVIVIVMVFVVPTLAQIFESQGAKLPFALQFVQNITLFLKSYGWLVLIILAILALLAKKYFEKRSARFDLHMLYLRIPLYGDIIRKSSLIMLSQTLSTMLEAGLPLMRSLDLLIKTQTLLPYQEAFISVKEQVTNGNQLSKSIPDEPLLFPRDFSELLSIGESSASLEDMLKKLAVQYNFELEYKLRNITTVLEPVALIIVAIFIAIFAFTVLGSIFDLMATFSV